MEPEPEEEGLSRQSTSQLHQRLGELKGDTAFALTCPYAAVCWEFARTLEVKNQLFNHLFDQCYCVECQRGRGAEVTGLARARVPTSGDGGATPSPRRLEPEPEDAGGRAAGGTLPPGWSRRETPDGKPYYFNEQTLQSSWERPAPTSVSAKDRALQLRGWVHFGLKLDDGRARARGAWDQWDTAFHGTTKDSFAKIVETGYLLKPGDVTPDGVELKVRDGHIAGGHLRPGRMLDRGDEEAVSIHDGGGMGIRLGAETFEPHKMVFVSPSLPYAAHDVYAQPSQFKGCGAKAVLKFKVHPDSHPTPSIPEDGGTGKTTVRDTPDDPLVAPDQMEWYTARHGVHILTGVLIKVDIEGRPGRQLQRAARRKIESAPAGAYVEGKWYHKRAGTTKFEQYPEPVSAQIEAAWLDGEGLVEVTPGCHVELKETKAPQAKERFFQQVSSAGPPSGGAVAAGAATWQWKDDTGWVSYPPGVSRRLDAGLADGHATVDVGGGRHVDLSDVDSLMQYVTAHPHRFRRVRQVSPSTTEIREPVVRVGSHTVEQRSQLVANIRGLQGDTPFGSSMDSVTNACEYHQAAWQVLQQFQLQAFLDHKWDRCFCASCMRKRGDHPVYRGGRHGPGDYVLPEGYAKFGLVIDAARAEARGFWEEWSVCYHGTRFSALKDIVECGYLLVPGDRNHRGQPVVPPEVVHRDDHRMAAPAGNQSKFKQIFTSPSIAYVSHPAYSEQIKGTDSKLYNVILQFRIKPDTYEVGPSTLKDTPEDQYVPEEEMEWFTPRHGVHLLYGILICRTSEMRS